jgi:predicted  nucleic acid-binding Zn-ribbon protein
VHSSLANDTKVLKEEISKLKHDHELLKTEVAGLMENNTVLTDKVMELKRNLTTIQNMQSELTLRNETSHLEKELQITNNKLNAVANEVDARRSLV